MAPSSRRLDLGGGARKGSLIRSQSLRLCAVPDATVDVTVPLVDALTATARQKRSAAGGVRVRCGIHGPLRT
jgi:hypothetical protein